ncbi:MAG: hypothetical protein JRF72_12780 [Deltaproteobacteria bacterium]|nr:hypothetical protein [Deltaproteobacteria bacterium]
MWYIIDTSQNRLKAFDEEIQSLEIGNRIVLENRKNESTERITIKGDGASLEEGILALKKGALVTELSLKYRSNNNEWKFTIKGESLNLSSLTTPATALPETADDVERFVMEKSYLYERIVQFIEHAFNGFIKLRISNSWNKSERQLVQRWINQSSR